MATNTVQQRFIEDRTRALAAVYLTRRDDRILTVGQPEIGITLGDAERRTAGGRS
ncbi:hypothetical protein ACYOEI_14700 [Singulisphaera rosea]